MPAAPGPGPLPESGDRGRAGGSLLILFLDASALVKRYVAEPGRRELLAAVRKRKAAASRLSEVEIASALARRCREGAFTDAERDRTVARLAADFRSLIIVELSEAVTLRAIGLTARRSLRAGDALQLAAALELRERLGEPIEFLAYDEKLREAARAEGFPTGGPSPARSK